MTELANPGDYGVPRPERPISEPAADLLGRVAFVARLARALASPGAATAGKVIGIVGPWGSGKSSVLNLLAAELATKEPKPVVVRFDPWLISGRDDLVLALIAEVHAALEAEPEMRAKAARFLEAAAPYVRTLGRFAGTVFSGAERATDEGLAALRRALGPGEGVHARKSALEQALADVDRPVIVLIDEIDRLRDDEIRTLAQLVRAVADFPQVSYVLAYDRHRVEQALGSDLPGSSCERLERGRAYLEKLVQMPITLPASTEMEREALLVSAVGVPLTRGVRFANLPEGREKKLRQMLLEHLTATPRDITRIGGLFRVLAGMVNNEVDTMDLLAMAAMQVKYPDLYRSVHQFPDRFAVDLGTAAGIAQFARRINDRDPEVRLAQMFPGVELTEPELALVEFLFPQPGSQNEKAEDGPNLVREARGLSVALRLGLPPGYRPRSELEAVFIASEAEIDALFAEWGGLAGLARFVEDAEDLYPFAPSPGRAFWLRAAVALRADPASWLPELRPARDLGDRISRMAVARVERHLDEKPVFAAIVQCLLEQDDVVILPFLLQRHVLAYGLGDHAAKPHYIDQVFLEETSARSVIKAQSVRVRQRFLSSEQFFFELVNLLPLFQMEYAGLWDETCAERLRALLADPRGAAQFALLGFGGNYTTEREALAHLMPTANIETAMDRQLEEVTESGNALLHRALLRAARRA